jgi:hypothetical protein
MDCQDLENLISAYTDGELKGTQLDLIEAHLVNCVDCRTKLTEYNNIRRQLVSLQATPVLPEIKGNVLARIEKARPSVKTKRRIHPALVFIPLATILVAALIFYLPGVFTNPPSVISKAYAATERLDSFRSHNTFNVNFPGTTAWVNPSVQDFEYADVKAYHFKWNTPEGYYPQQELEITVIDNKVYSRQIPDRYSSSRIKAIVESLNQGLYDNSIIPSRNQTLAILTSMNNIVNMGDESIDGAACFHYQGIVNNGKYFAELKNKLSQQFSASDPAYQVALKVYEDWQQTKGINVELWIDKDDYFVRQLARTIYPVPNASNTIGYTSKTIEKYYDFNQPITIRAPLTDTGDLLPGWYVDSLP